MGAKGSKAKEKKRKGGHQLRSENNNSTEPKSQASSCLREKSLGYVDIKETNGETAKEKCLITSCNGKVSGDPDDEIRTVSHRHSDSATVRHPEKNSSAQHLRRSLPPLPLSVVSKKECLAANLPEQTSTSTIDDADGEPFTFPNEPTVVCHNGLEVVDSQVQAIKEGSTAQKRDGLRGNREGHYATMKTSNESRELGEIDEVPGYENSKTLEFCSENRPSTSTGKCKAPNDGDTTYMCIDTVQTNAESVNDRPDLTEDKTERNLAENECRINHHDGNANGVTEKIAQNLTRVNTLESENWNKENGADDDPFSYAEACMTQNKLPKKGDTRVVVRPENTAPEHNQKAFRLSAVRTPNYGHTDVEHLNFPNAAAAAQVPRFPSQNSFSGSQWLNNNTIKHMNIFILMKAESDTHVTCTVSLCVLIGLAGPNTITKCLEDRIQKLEKNNFLKVNSFEVPLLNYSCSSIFTVMVSHIKWLPQVDVVSENINSEVFEMNRFMNDSVVEPLFWQYLQLPKGILKEQKFAATVSIQQDNCPEISFKILENLQKVSDLPSVDVAKVSHVIEDSVVNRRLCGFAKQITMSRLSIASNFELDLHSDGSAPDNNVLPDKIREKTKPLEHFFEPEPCGLYLPN